MTTKYKNRYGNKYCYEEIEKGVIAQRGELEYWRFGGREGQDKIDDQDLGMCDPSGGPYITIGSNIEGKTVTRISVIHNPEGAIDYMRFEVR